MSTIAGSPKSIASASGLEPLRAKSGWIVALGVVYVIAGLVALGSVVMATVATVFLVGVMMLIAGAAEVINAFQIKTWGKFLLWILPWRSLHRRWFCHVREPAPCRGNADAFAGNSAACVRYRADRVGLQHESGDALDLGTPLRRRDASVGRSDFGALAGLRPLHTRALPRHRSRAGGRELDRYRPWPQQA